MNVKVIEYGLRITGVTYDDIMKHVSSRVKTEWKLDEQCGAGEEDRFAKIHGRTVETRPWGRDYIFISFTDDPNDEFEEIPSPPATADRIIEWFGKHLPEARVKWSLIRTER